MNIVGKWKIAKITYVDPETFEKSWEDPNELLSAGKIDDDYAAMIRSIYIFEPDGSVKVVLPLPEGVSQEEIDAAVKAGEVEIYGDNMMVLEKKAWKEENGKIFFDTQIKGEMLGETVDPWVELTEENGLVQVLTNLLEKID